MNFRGILSKSSLRSSSSGKSLTHSEEISKLQKEIETLKETIDSLKVSVESRDAAVGTLAREKEKMYVELKSAQRTNRNLHQQLVDERDIHSKEKEFLIHEIKRLSKRNEQEEDAERNKDGDGDQPMMSLTDQLKAKDEVIYNIGAKYLKMKSTKVHLQKKLQKMHEQNKKTCEKIILLLQDNRKTLDHLLDNLLKSSTLSPDGKKFLNLLQINASLHYENTQLKISLSAKKSANMLHQDSNYGQELSEQSCSLEKNKSATKHDIIKFDKTTNKNVHEEVCHRIINSKLKSLTSHDCAKLKGFNYTHQTCSPNGRGALNRSASDSCILRRNLSELLNINE